MAKSEIMTDINDCNWLENSEELESNAKDSGQPSEIISETPVIKYKQKNKLEQTKKRKQSEKSDSEPQSKITRQNRARTAETNRPTQGHQIVLY